MRRALHALVAWALVVLAACSGGLPTDPPAQHSGGDCILVNGDWHCP